MLQNAECLARSLDNRHNTINGDGRVAGQVELLELSGSASNGEQVIVGDGHERCVAENLQTAQLAKVDRLKGL